MTTWRLDTEGNRILATDDPETVVCTLVGSCRNPDVLSDARKMVAAPDMLATLCFIAGPECEYDNEQSDSDIGKDLARIWSQMRSAARAAIAKAGG